MKIIFNSKNYLYLKMYAYMYLQMGVILLQWIAIMKSLYLS